MDGTEAPRAALPDGPARATFGQILRQYRLRAGLTQERLAERSGLGTRSLQHLERGETLPQRGTAQRLAAALALSMAERQAFEALAQPVPRRPADRGAAGQGLAAESAEQGRLTATRALARTGPGDAHNLPATLTSFVGRAPAMAAVLRLLDTARLLTLTGPGGCGKTRLALHVARTLLGRYAHGVWLVELAALDDPTLVFQGVATVLGLREEAGQPLAATVTAALRPRHLLLVLDNCEHLVAACAAVAALLVRECPDLRILTTSREALGITGEVAWPVPSLDVPDLEPLPPLEALRQVEAVQLFLDRAGAVQPDFTLTPHNAAAVAQVCRRLDGLPLAIELAAARVRGLGVDQLAARLDQRFRLLTQGNRAALPRQQTLHATLEWSYALLSAPEQTLFTRLSVFAGSFTLEAAEAVCAGGALVAEDVPDLLPRLVDKSLVSTEGSGGDVERYRLLETLRHFGRQRTQAGGEAAGLDARHTVYYRVLAEDPACTPTTSEQASSTDQLETARGKAPSTEELEAERMNFRQALRWAITTGTAQEGLQLAGALWGYWHDCGYMAEGVQWLTEVLALPGAEARTCWRAAALVGLAYLSRSARFLVGVQAVGADTHALAAEAVSIARETGPRWLLASALRVLGGWAGREDYAAGRAMLEEGRALWRESSFPRGEGLALNRLGDLAYEQGDTVAAHAWWSEGLLLARQVGDQGGYASHLEDLGMLAYHQGDYATARGQLTESLALYRTLHSRTGICLVLGALGAVARAQGDTALARACYEEKLARWREVGDRAGIAAALAELGAVAQQEGDFEQAQALFGEALALRRELGDRAGLAASLALLGGLAHVQEDPARSAALYQEALDLAHATGDRAAAAMCLEGLAALAMAGRTVGARGAALWGRCLPARGNIRPRCVGRSALPRPAGGGRARGAGRGGMGGGVGGRAGHDMGRCSCPVARGHRHGAARAIGHQRRRSSSAARDVRSPRVLSPDRPGPQALNSSATVDVFLFITGKTIRFGKCAPLATPMQTGRCHLVTHLLLIKVWGGSVTCSTQHRTSILRKGRSGL